MAGFTFRKSLVGRNTGVVLPVVVTNSDTHVVGDMVHLEAGSADNQIGVADNAVAGERLAGVIVGFVDKKGTPLDHPNADLSAGGTWTQRTLTFVADSDNDNTAGAQVKALVNIDPWAVYSNNTDGTFGTTADTDKLGSYIDLIDEDDVDENNNGAAVTTVAQLMCLGPDPEASGYGLYKIVESQFAA